MKNNKGFTLVEVIAVIVILALLVIIAIPSVTKILFGSRETISSLNRRNLEEAGKMFAQDIFMCSAAPEIIEVLNNELSYDVTSCKEVTDLLETGISINVDFLKDNQYFSDNSNKCSGDMFISITDIAAQKISVDLDEVECSS